MSVALSHTLEAIYLKKSLFASIDQQENQEWCGDGMDSFGLSIILDESSSECQWELFRKERAERARRNNYCASFIAKQLMSVGTSAS